MNLDANKVLQSHLSRDAYLYIRQSTLKQFFRNSESTKRQYALKENAMALGWPSDKIHIVDSDVGQSGSSSDQRSGFQWLVAEVGLGHAGIVLGLEVSRLARNSSDWHRLIEICGLSQTLLLDEDGLYNPSNFNDRLLLGLKGTMSEAELHIMRDRLLGGILNKARRAELEMPLPIGFRLMNSKVKLDGDQLVRRSVSEFFKVFRTLGSATATVKYFRKNGLKFPRLVRTGSRKGEVLWDSIRHSQALRILHNPRYAGVFSYGKTKTIKTIKGKSLQKKIPRKDWLVFIPNAHEGYISLEEYEDNQEIIRNNTCTLGSDQHRPPREGPALLQGLVICGRCGKRMTIRYHDRRGNQIPDYVCQSYGIETGGKSCQVINGYNIDKTVFRIVEEHVNPETIEMSFKVETELKQHQQEVLKIKKLEIEKAKYEANLSERRYKQVDPDNRLVAANLEADWNEKLKNVAEAEKKFQNHRFSEGPLHGFENSQDFNALVIKFKKLWSSEKLSNRDRKRIVHMLIADVTLLKDKDRASMKILYKGGKSEQLLVTLPSRAWIMQKTDREIIAKIDNLLNSHTPGEIAEILNEQGLKTGTGKSFNEYTIPRIIKKYGLAKRFERLKKQGYLTMEEISKKYQVPLGTVRIWSERKLIFGIPYDDRNRRLFKDPANELPIMIKHRWELPTNV